MTTTHFKLTHSNGLTRRVTFQSQPTWPLLAAKIGSLYGISTEKVSVAYIDADNDCVTLNSQEELEDFYQACHKPGQIIKFTVQDLSSARAQGAIPESPHTNIRNTFGGPVGAFGIEDDWQALPLPSFPSLGGIFLPGNPATTHSHAFVEVVGSEAGTTINQHEDSKDHESTRHSTTPSPRNTSMDKGKERAIDDDISSTGSVLAEDTPTKFPVHVYDISSRDQVAAGSYSPHAADIARNSVDPVGAESTPKFSIQGLVPPEPDNNNKGVPKSRVQSPEDPTDPPLPSIESSTSNISLSNDVASLLNMFSNIVMAHPELSEGIRDIARKASNGAYWNANREAISETARGIAQSIGGRPGGARGEEEAGRRVADAVGGIVRTLSQTLGAVNIDLAQPHPPTTENTVPHLGAQPSRSQNKDRPASWLGPNHHEKRDIGIGQLPHTPWTQWKMRSGQHWEPRTTRGSLELRDKTALEGECLPPVSQAPPLPGGWDTRSQGSPLPPPPSNPPAQVKPTPQELKAQVDAAKARYKIEKERYRQERVKRHQEKEARAHQAGDNMNTVFEPNAPPVMSRPKHATIAVHGRKGNPTLEVVSVHRNNTHPGHGFTSRHTGHEQSDLTSRGMNRISKRLADMGFTENAYPDLPTKIKAHVSSRGALTKDNEDDIVTTLLEELLALSPKPAVASGSGLGDRNVPGAWH